MGGWERSEETTEQNIKQTTDQLKLVNTHYVPKLMMF